MGGDAGPPTERRASFYVRLNQILDTAGFDDIVEAQCAPLYARTGRLSLPPGRYVRLLLGYFEGATRVRAMRAS